MQRLYLEENDDGVQVQDATGREIAHFYGQNALAEAMQWAQQQALALYSLASPDALNEYHPVFYPRKIRFGRFLRLQASRKPPKAPQVIIISDDFFEDEALPDEEIDPFLDSAEPDIILAPADEDDYE